MPDRPGSSVQLRGARGGISAAHPLASSAGETVLGQGGNAVDAAIAAQAVICAVMPNAAGIGGDLLALVRLRDGEVVAINGTGACAADARPGHWQTGANAVTTPGLVSGWSALHSRFGRLPMATLLEPAIQLTRDGVVPDDPLLAAVASQQDRLQAGGADTWELTRTRPGQVWRQPELSKLLSAITVDGPDAFYRGSTAEAVAAAVRRHGGRLDASDLAAQVTDVREPVSVGWASGQVYVQPPMSQGVLLAMALNYLENAPSARAALDAPGRAALDHLLVELTEATFEHRSSCSRGAELLTEPLEVNLERAGRRGGPRGYLHTAGVAAADADGLVVSSLISVFDDFGSGVFVPELGITLNNRAAGFTDGANAPAPGKKPVHTLAPAMAVGGDQVLAIATPGADGQVQTLLQILTAVRYKEVTLAEAVSALRWRSESGQLLVEAGHPAAEELTRRGHLVAERAPGDSLFGGVVAAGYDPDGPFCLSDWRRAVTSAVI